MRFFTILLLIYVGWQLFKWVAGWAIRRWIRKNGGRAFYYSGNFGGYRPPETKTQGEVIIDSFGNKNRQPQIKPNEGEYVDFEEIK